MSFFFFVSWFTAIAVAQESDPPEQPVRKKAPTQEELQKAQQSVSTERRSHQPPPIAQDVLQEWWKSAGKLRMGDSAYRVGDVTYHDGLCKVDLSGGVMIPVFTGKAPVSERMIGMLYVGDGELSVSFPERADAWGFANHMVRRAGKSTKEMAPVARQEQPYKVKIDRGLILSADPEVSRLVYNLDPIGGGIYFEENNDGDVDATYVVTERRGKLRAQLIATNVLADRADQLERIGIDPRAMLRQDRLMHEELRFPGHHLRVISDFRTKQRFHVAGQEGTIAGGMAYDKWLTCYRDGRDEANTGFRAMVFSHGFDSDKRRHFQRFAGARFLGVKDLEAPRPPIRMDPISAQSVVEFRPVRRGSSQRVTVDSQLTMKAVGSNLQYVAMQLPTVGARRGTWRLEAIELEDGSPLAWAGLNADLDTIGFLSTNRRDFQDETGQPSFDNTNQSNVIVDDSANDDVASSQETGSASSEVSGGGEAQFAEKIQPTNPLQATQLQPTELSQQEAAEQEINLFQERTFTYKILALLPKIVPEGEEVTIRLRWSADWLFSNISILNGSDSTQVRVRGTTTGMKPYLPELLPSPGGTSWDFSTKVGAPSRYSLFRSQSIAASGDTKKIWQDEGLWNWIDVKGSNAVLPTVGVGRWKVLSDPSAKGLPSIRVNLFPAMAGYAKQFPPEVRRVISFFQRFLPKFPQREVEIFQDASTNVLTANTKTKDSSGYGVVAVEQVTVGGVGRVSRVRDQEPYMAQAQIASQIASQYWGQLLAPNSERDSWLSYVISDSYAAFYIRAALGLDVYEQRISELKKKIENPLELNANWKKADAKRRFYSQTGSTRYSDIPKRNIQDYGLYVFSEMLRLRIGNQAFFSAMDQLAKERNGKRITSEQVQAKLEMISKSKLDDFFDYWIHGGYIPNLKLSYRQDSTSEGNILFGCLESDVPFGTFDLPVRVSDKDGARVVDAFVEVKDGYGTFIAKNRDDDVTLEIDPIGLSLSYDRKVVKVNGKTKCPTDDLNR